MNVKRRLFRSGTSMLLVLVMLITNVPNFGLLGKVLANPKPDQVAVEEGVKKPKKEKEKKDKKDKKKAVPEEGVVPLSPASIKSLRAGGSGNMVQQTPAYDKKEFIAQVPEYEKKEFVPQVPGYERKEFEPQIPAYEKIAIPEDIVYDEIYEEDVVITTATTYTNKKIWFKGNVSIHANVYFNYSTAVISGDVMIQAGVLGGSGSTILIGKDLRVQAKQEDENFGETAGTLQVNGKQKVIVEGDFYTQSINNSFVYGTGVLELRGNFYQVGDTTFGQTSHTGTIVFTGNEEQHLSFASTSTGNVKLGSIIVANQHGKLYVDTPILGMDLAHNTILKGDYVELLGGNSKGYDLQIEGTHLIATKNKFHLLSNTGVSNQSSLFVEGDLRVQTLTSEGTFGETAGSLQVESGTKVVVKGDFYTQGINNAYVYNKGILELRGNFYQVGDTYFGQTGHTGTIVFTGDGEQHISFESTSTGKIRLGYVVVANRQGKLYADTPILGMELTHNTTIKGDYVELLGGHSRGHDLQIEGTYLIATKNKYNLLANTGNQPSLFVEGDLRVQTRISEKTFGETMGSLQVEAGTKVVVKGDLYTQGIGDAYVYNTGVLELRGNFYQVGDTYFGQTGHTGTIVFTGDGEQHVSFESTSTGKIRLGYVVVANKQGKLYADTPILGMELTHNTTIKGDYVELLGGYSRGHDLQIEGTYLIATKNKYNLLANTGNQPSLFVEGDLRVQTRISEKTFGETMGSLQVEAGTKVVVKGDLYTQGIGDAYVYNTGVLELRGNFYQVGDTYFGQTGHTGTIVFTGDGEQHVSFESTSTGKIRLGYVVVANKQGKLYADTPILGMELTHNTTIKGDYVELLGGYSRGHDLQIEGTYLIATKNKYNLLANTGNQPSLFVEGDLRIQTRSPEGDFEVSDGSLQVEAGTKVVVKGDFYTQSINNGYVYNTGVLELRGSFYQVGDTYFGQTGHTGTIAFTGEGEQHVSFESTSTGKIRLGSIVVANEQGKLYADTPILGINLTHNTIIKGDYVEILDGYSRGYDLKIEGNYLIQSRASRFLLQNKSSLFVEGDFRMQTRNEDGSFAEAKSGAMYMPGEGTTVVKGDFYTQTKDSENLVYNRSVLELHKNFYQIGATYFGGFYPTGGDIVFAGEGKQEVFAEDASKLNLVNVIQNKSCTELHLNGDPVRISIASDIVFGGNPRISNLTLNGQVAKFLGSVTITGTVNFNQGALLADQNLTVKNAGVLNLDGGVLNVKGDLHLKDRSRLFMHNDNDLALIGGSIYNDSTEDQSISRGLLDIKGNYRQTTTSSFRSGANAIVQFSNPAHQSIAFPDKANVWFYNLGLDPGMRYTFTRQPIWTNLMGAMDVSGVTKGIAPKYFGQAGTNAATGNYSQSFENLQAESVIGPLEMGHTYNSLDEEDGILGVGFTFSQSMKLKIETKLNKEYVTVTMPNGARSQFAKNADGSYTSEDSRDVLRKEGGSYVLTSLDKTTLVFNEQGQIQSLEDKSGNRLTYQNNQDGNITSITDVSGTSILFTYDGKKLVQVKNEQTGEITTFGYTNGKLTTSTNSAKKTTTYEYGDHGLLTRLLRHDGAIFEEVTYVSGGKHDKKIHTVKNVVGNIETYVYDEYFRKTTIIDSNNRKTIKEFDSSYSITRTMNPLGEVSTTSYVLENGKNKYAEVASEMDTNGNTTSYGRDMKGHIVRTTYPNGSTELTTYDKNDNIIRTVDANGMTTFFTYDESNKFIVKKIEGIYGDSSYTEQADPNKFAITSYTYDTDHVIKGLMTRETHPLGNGKNYQAFSYNQKGLATTKTTYIEGKAYATKITYNEKQQPIQEVDPEGVVTSYVYNVHEEVVRKEMDDGTQSTVERTTYNSMGQKLLEASPLQYDSSKDNVAANTYQGAGTAYTYDVAGNVITETDALGNCSTKEYDIYGNVVKEIAPNGSYKTNTYDVLDRKVSESFFDHTTGETRQIENISYERSGYNSQTTIRKQIDVNKAATISMVTDYAGREISSINAEGITTRKSYTLGGHIATETNELGQVAKYTYDLKGNVLSKTTPFEGNVLAKTVYTYDKMGNKLSEVVDNQKVSDLATTRKTTYQYDAWGRLHTTVRYHNEEAVSYVQTYYDYKGRALRDYKGLFKPLTITGLDQVAPTGDSDYTVTKKAYNYLDKVVKSTDGVGKVTTTTYDMAGNPLTTKDPAGGVVSTTYDLLGRKITETKTMPNKAGVEEYTSYDSQGKPLSITTNGVAKVYTYDGASNLKTEQQGTIEKSFTYDYGKALLSTKIKEGGTVLKETNRTYDVMGRLATIKEGNVVKATYTYDKGSRLLTTTHENGLTETNTYNLAGLPIKVVNRDAKKQVISEYAYTYAVDGNQLSKKDLGGETIYKYDGMNRLVEEVLKKTDHQTAIAYTYDENNNRLSKKTNNDGTVVLREYKYDQLDQLLSEKDQKETMTYTYDKLGNMLTKTKNGKTEKKEYDVYNRLLSWTDGTKKATYTYQADHKRASKTVDGKTTEHIWTEGEIQLEKMEGQLVTYTHGKGLVDSTYGTYLYNANGDVVQLVKNDKVVARYDYDAYGNATDKVQEEKQDETDFNPFRYGGEYRDTETKYVYLRARYYDPDLGRFINQDPAMDGENWHAYAGANPVMFNDPSGLFFKKAAKAAKKAGDKIKKAWNDVKKAARKSMRNVAKKAKKAVRSGKLDSFLSFVLSADKDGRGKYHMRPEAKQSIFGFNDLYDAGFLSFSKTYGAKSSRDKLKFEAGGEQYVLWSWKGDYFGLGAGGETGLYRKSKSIQGHYDAATDVAMRMEHTIAYKDDKDNPFIRYSPDEKQWWITSFDPTKPITNADDLYMETTLYFDGAGGEELWEGFYDTYSEEADKYGIEFDEKNKTATIKW